MIKHIREIALFTVGQILILLLLSALFIPKNTTMDAGMEEVRANSILAEPENTIDVVFIGNSECYSAINPLELYRRSGITSYNCGTVGQKLYYTETILHRALRNQKPKVVVLEAGCLYKSIYTPRAVYEKLATLCPLLRYHDRWKQLSLDDFSPVRYNSPNENKGFKRSDLVDPGVNESYMKDTEKVNDIAEINMMYLRQIKDYCEENGAELILISVPSPVNWDYEKHNGTAAAAKELGLEFVDMNLMPQAVSIDWETDTRDAGDHLNYKGAQKVTDYLADYLAARGEFSDHRNDPAYADWDEASQKPTEDTSM